jgi:exonuclease VII large subunit
LGARLAALAALSPTAVLNRGYALVSDATTGEIIRRADDGRRDRTLHIRVADGSFGATATGAREEA